LQGGSIGWFSGGTVQARSPTRCPKYGFWSANYLAFDGDVIGDLAAQFPPLCALASSTSAAAKRYK
jgi:hypothetical protein